MLNHQYNECEANCEWGVCKKTGSIVVRSRWGARDIKKGTELTMSYGSLGASSALLNYGFVPIINPEGFADTDTFKFKTASISVQLPIILGVMAASAAAAESESVETVVETDVASSGVRAAAPQKVRFPRGTGVYSSDWRLGERRIVLGVGTRGAAMTLLSSAFWRARRTQSLTACMQTWPRKVGIQTAGRRTDEKSPSVQRKVTRSLKILTCTRQKEKSR